MMKSLPNNSPGGLPADENPTVDENDPAGQISALSSLHHQQQQQQQHFRHHMPSFASSQCFDSKPEPESVPQQQQPDFLQPSEPSAASSEEAAPMFRAQQQQQPMLPICAQCAQPIADPYILRMHPDLEFHPGCLKCAECDRLLDETAGSAFVRDGKILCRDDYIRLYSYRRCQRCDMQVQPSDFVMRARQLVFHRNCFTCIVCNHLLMPGEQFLLHRDELCCRPQCLMQSQGFAALPPQFVPLHLPPAPAAFPSAADKSGTGDTAQFELAQLMGGTTTKSDEGPPSHQRQNSMPNASSSAIGFQRAPPPGCPSAVSSGASPLSFSNPDESMTPDSTNASTPTTNGGNLGGHFPGGGGGSGHSFEAAMAAGMVYSSGGAMGGAMNGQQGGSNCSSSSSSLMVVAPKYAAKKSKKEKSAQRVRTVLNESQLKMLRQAYNQNQRPDTGTKEQLVEMTGLNARVIRVWFQNKRCKDKKRQLEHREKMQNQEKEHALRGVRLSGIGPLTAASPGPMDQQHSQLGGSGSHHQQHQQQFPTAVEIHQLTQNHASLFCRNDDGKMVVPMEEGGMCPTAQNNNHLFQHANGTAMAMLSMPFQVPNGVPPEFMNLNPAVML